MIASPMHQGPGLAPSASTVQSPTHKSAVYEYSCLFTHDIRRKNTKRWQDGFLRFHFFNKRVMVYDQSRNYIGDTHFRDAGPDGLEDGEELKLERGGVIAQVGEKLSVQETDLSDLLAKRAPKQPAEEKHQSRRSADKPGVLPSPQLQPRSSNISPIAPGRPSGWIGRRQIPKQSRFEREHTEVAASPDVGFEQARSAKRRKHDDDEHVPLRHILKLPNGPRNRLSTAAASNSAVEITTSNLRSAGKDPSRGRSNKDSKNAASRSVRNHKNLVNPASSPETPAYRPEHSKLSAPEVVGIPSSPPVSTTNQIPICNDKLGGGLSAGISAAPFVENLDCHKGKTKPLRFATSAPRKMLYCQSMGAALPQKQQPIRSRGSGASTGTDETDNEHRVVGNVSRKKPPRAVDLSASEAASNVLQRAFTPSFNDDPVTISMTDQSKKTKHTKAQSTPQEQIAVPFRREHEAATVIKDIRDGTTPLDPQNAISKRKTEHNEPHSETSTTAMSAAKVTTLSTSTTTAAPPRQHRPLRRHNSDTSPNMAKASTRRSPLKRADTVSVIPSPSQERKKVSLKPDSTSPRLLRSRRPHAYELEAAGARDTDLGPWSREAWDLFGWCPEGREEVLAWGYGSKDMAAAC